MTEARIAGYHRASLFLALAILPVVAIIAYGQSFSLRGFALMGIDAACILFHAVRWKLLPEKTRFALYAAIVFNCALPSVCLFSYSALGYGWTTTFEHPTLILYAVMVSLSLLLKEGRFVYVSTAISVGGYVGVLGLAALANPLRPGAVHLGAGDTGYVDVASPLFIVSILVIYGVVMGREMQEKGDVGSRGERLSIGLSPREEEIALLMSEGLEHKEIASKLNISLSTVKNHVKKLYAKRGARNKIELINDFRGKGNRKTADGPRDS